MWHDAGNKKIMWNGCPECKVNYNGSEYNKEFLW
jgi:hypothetical protein